MCERSILPHPQQGRTLGRSDDQPRLTLHLQCTAQLHAEGDDGIQNGALVPFIGDDGRHPRKATST